MSNAAASSTAPDLTREQVVTWRNAVFVIFSLSGLGLASWVARIPSVRDSLHASTELMGIVAFGLAAGSIVGLVFSSHVLVRFGPARTIGGAVVVSAAGLTLAGLASTLFTTPVLAIVGLALFGAGTGMCDVAMNVEGAANERALGRTVMPLFHAAFSVGTVAGALLGGLAEKAHLAIAVHLGIIASVMVVAVALAVRKLPPHPDAVTPEVSDDGSTAGWRSRLLIWKNPRILLIGLIVLGMAFAEGSATDWLALAMVDGHHVGNATGSFVFGIFVAAMTIGRVAGVRLLDRFGRVLVLRSSAVLAAAGLLIVIFVPSAAVAAIGVVLWGLGASLGFPVGMSAAADDPKNAAASVSVVATIGYFAFLVGPPSIGFLGQHVGLLHALLLVLVLVGLAGLTAGASRKPETGAAPTS
ncbi:MFS transporter [Nakamurella panacisegetis]|nr:MFS transporter [Nakamurella panacisegetis]